MQDEVTKLFLLIASCGNVSISKMTENPPQLGNLSLIDLKEDCKMNGKEKKLEIITGRPDLGVQFSITYQIIRPKFTRTSFPQTLRS